MAASAMYPLPDDMSLPNDPTDPMVRNAPPIPATRSARMTLRYRVSRTLMPTLPGRSQRRAPCAVMIFIM